jgi:hypothetical protein
MKYNRAVLTLQTVTLLLFLIVLTACSHNMVILQGNHVVKLQQNELAPFSGWLIQDEALARILEKAEACQVKK